MTDKVIITRPGEYCRADGVKVRIVESVIGWRIENNGLCYADDGGVCGYHKDDPERIISTWSDCPDEFRKPKPAYRKDGTSRWPVGTKAVLVAWEDGETDYIGDTITVREDGPRWDDVPHLIARHNIGHRPLFRKLPEPAPLEPTEAHGGNPRDMRSEDKAFFGLDGGQTLVLYGKINEDWYLQGSRNDTHRMLLTLHDDGRVTGDWRAM